MLPEDVITAARGVVVRAEKAPGILAIKVRDIVKLAAFHQDITGGKDSVVITSLNTVDSAAGRRSASAGSAPLNTEGADEAALRVVTVGGTDMDGNAYVIVRAGARLSDLSFEIRTSRISGKLKGIPESAGAEVAVSGGVYFIGADGWHDYIVAGGRKWATVNVGATSRSGRESFGHFFSWGNVVGYSFSGVDWKVAPGYPGEGAECPQRRFPLSWPLRPRSGGMNPILFCQPISRQKLGKNVREMRIECQ